MSGRRPSHGWGPPHGPLAQLEGYETTLDGPDPDDPARQRRPWVVATADRVLKGYDLSLLDPIARERVRAEARTAVKLGDLDGVVTTYGQWEQDGWLVIEMDRLRESVAGHLAAVAAGNGKPLAGRRWGVLIEGVARTLGRVHARGIVHRDVKPGNLLFDASAERLLVADFSISTRAPKRRRRSRGEVDRAGTPRYIAPEIADGRIGPAADQYALAVTAREVLGNNAAPAAKAVLERATELDPADRYPAIEDFGADLRGAVDDRAPRRLSSRMRRVSPRWRITWGPGITAFAASYTLLLWLRPPGINVLAGLAIPLLFALPWVLGTWMLSGLRAGRSQPRLGIADRGWFPVALLGLVLLGLAPVLAEDRSLISQVVFWGGVGVLWASAMLGSLPTDAGDRMIGVVGRWERWRAGQRGRPLRWWCGRMLLVGLVAAVSALPAAMADRWPGATTPTGERARSLVVVAQLRAALLAGRIEEACGLMRVPRNAGKARCHEWAPLAGRWLRADARERGALAITPDVLGDTRLAVASGATVERPRLRITTSGDERRDIGLVEQSDWRGKVWDVTLTRRQPTRDPLLLLEAYWRYEVLVRGEQRLISSIEACDGSRGDGCVRLTQTDRSDLAALERHGPR